MSQYKTVRKDGRYVTIDVNTGQEVVPFQGNLKFVGDALNKIGVTAKIGLSDLINLPGDIAPHLIYSDTAVDSKGRPLTKAQAGEHNYNRDKRVKEFLNARGAQKTKPENKGGLTELSDGSLRTSGGDVYSADGKRYTTSGGVTYDLATGQAVNPATNTILETGYSIDPSTGERSDSVLMKDDRTNEYGITQKGRNFDSMAENIFKAMAERNANTGVAASTLAAINSMNPVSKYSSTNLPATDTNIFTNTEGSINSFENPGIAVNTGAVQPRDPNVNFSSAYARQFERPVDMPSVATTPGVKNPVEYTNYMTNDLALGSMDALRMNEKQKRLIYASGQYWGEGADGKAVKVDRDLARKVKRGAEGAEELLANFLGRGNFVEADAGYTAADYNSQGQLLNDRNLLTFKDGSQRYLSDIPEDEDLSATY